VLSNDNVSDFSPQVCVRVSLNLPFLCSITKIDFVGAVISNLLFSGLKLHVPEKSGLLPSSAARAAVNNSHSAVIPMVLIIMWPSSFLSVFRRPFRPRRLRHVHLVPL
jgi:hypothetical protein